MAGNTLKVYLLGSHIGNLHINSGRLSFRYLPSYVKQQNALPLSATLPVQERKFGHNKTEAFFSGLLPDELVRKRLARYLNISAQNTFALLAEIGGECAGAVSLYPEGTSPHQYQSSHYRILAPEEALDLLINLEARPMMAGDGDIRISGAGAQEKLVIAFADGKIAIPRGNTPSTHIIKPPIKGLQESVFNEYFCMRLAKETGLPTAEASIYPLEGTFFYLTKRYDRVTDASKTIRLHQEDFCQAMGIPPHHKYENEGGPNLVACFDLLDSFIKKGQMPGAEKRKLLQGVIFNYLIGNGDAHAKNFSLLYRGEAVFLAPFYDLLCTVVYANAYKTKMAMKIGGQYKFRDVGERHFHALAEKLGMKPDFVEKELKTMAAALPKKAAELASELQELPGLKADIYKDILKVIHNHCRHYA